MEWSDAVWQKTKIQLLLTYVCAVDLVAFEMKLNIWKRLLSQRTIHSNSTYTYKNMLQQLLFACISIQVRVFTFLRTKINRYCILYGKCTSFFYTQCVQKCVYGNWTYDNGTRRKWFSSSKARYLRWEKEQKRSSSLNMHRMTKEQPKKSKQSKEQCLLMPR